MKNILTDYTFSFKGEVTVTVTGAETDSNYEKAKLKALAEALDVIDNDSLEFKSSTEYTEEG